MLILGKHVFSQLKVTLSSISLKVSLSQVRKDTCLHLKWLGDNLKRGGQPPLPWVQLSKWLTFLLVKPSLMWRGGTMSGVVATN